MACFYRLLLISIYLCFSLTLRAQVPVAVDDNPAPTLEDTPTTFNVTDNDTEILAQIDPATVDLDLSAGGIQDTFTNSAGDWSVDTDGDVTYTPTLNFSGVASTTYTVQNDLAIPVTSLPATITITVTAENDLPTITGISDQTILENSTTGALAFTIGDVETPASDLDVTGASNNATLVPDASIVFAGNGEDRDVTVTPVAGQTGTATITITVSDGDLDASIDFVLTVNANTAPTITPVGPQSTVENTPTSAITFTVDDAFTQPGSLTLSGNSSNTTLVPDANIAFGGSGASREVVITPAAGQIGTATITITVSDGALMASTNFVLTVIANTAPTITAIAPQSTNENTPTSAITFTIGDAETQPGGLTLSATSSNTTLIPNANITFGGSGASRNVVITPASGQSGTTTITITVSDGSLDASTNFVLTVNDAPTITAIGPQSTNENTPTPPITFTIGDAETQPGGLTLAAASSNTTLVPDANITFGGSGASRNVVVTPVAGESGTTTITVTVSDGALTASANFVLTVNAAPTITAIGPQSTNENTPTAPITFTIGDAETQLGSLTLAAASSNTTLVPDANITFGGTGASRNVVVTPVAGESGTATITVTVSDGALTASANFVLTVNAAPTITAIGPQSTNENTPTAPITFTIGDAETQAGSLTLAAASSNTTLVPDANITFGGTGANRNVVVTPVAGGSGTATITVTVSDGALTASTNFVLTVNANTAPTITAIGPQSTNENTPTGPIAFTIGDAETQPSGLTLAGTSSNATLVPNANITFGGGTGADRNVVITPVAGESGTATITIAVSDGTLNASTNFVLTVNAANTAPTITAIGPQSTNENTPTGPIAFTIGDAETQPSGLTLSGTSSNATLVPNANITFGGGTGASRNVVITPVAGESGTATITIAVSDGTLNASTNFVLTVNAANTAPTITAIGPQSTNENTPTGPIAFTIGDAETQPSGLTLAGTSSNATLVPNANITFGGGTGASRNVVITPVAGESGTATITISVSDGTLNASTNFVLTVNAANTAPTITAIGPQSTNENTPTGPIAFTIGDAETQPSGLTLSGTSSNATLVPNANITFGGGTGASRNVVITPVAGESGTATITIAVSDGTLNASTNFVLTVNAANTAPTITAIGPQSTNENTPTGPIAFTIGDAETQPSGLTLAGTSSNATLVPNANITFGGGTGASRNVVITPVAGESGTATITIAVSDGTLNASTNFVLTVNAANTAPTITAIGPQSTNENTPTGPIAFTIGDAETQPSGLTLSGTSSNATLVPNANITFGGGTGASRNVVITPATGESGTATITVTVSDGALTASTNFVLTVNANTAPTITAIGPQSTNENTPTPPITFTIGDAETQPSGLTLAGTSSNATLVPNANITFGGGTGASRNVVITPVAGESGTATITIAVSDGTLNASTNFVLTVNAANTAPTITAIGPQSTNENTPTPPITFTIGDAETQPSGLTLAGTSSNATLVPNANITFGGGTGVNRNVVITPATGESGTATITVTVSDGALTASTNFVLTVNANTAPTITAIGPQSTNENTPTPPITFTIGDAETQPSGLTLAGTSSNATLVPNANITFGGGTGASRNVVITPVAGESGTATITIAVSDGTLNASTNFVLTVNAANTAPTITAIGPQSTNENTPTPPITFTIGDAETQPSGLTLAGTSSNATLVPNANITFGGGTGASRNVVITPVAGESGTATITIAVSDGTLNASTNFVLTVNAANTAPTITAIGPQSTNENTPTPPITFTIGDAETQPSGLTLAGTSSNATLVPNANITFGGGTGASRNVVITPVAGESGTATITIAVSDGTLNASTNFVLTVNAANTAPTITAIGPQSTNENTPTGPIAFTIGDAETQPSGLTLSGTSSNATLVPNANITFGGGTGASRNVVITPVAGESGTATITIAVSDGTLNASTNFVLTVNAANTAPTITAIGPQSTNENTPTGPIAFTIGDAETQPSGLTLAGTSSNATLVPNANITFGGGTGASRNVVITPVAGESGTATITISVSDGTLNASTNFVLTVNAANTAPTITAIGPQSTNENTPTGPIAFTIGDAETQPSGLTLSGTSSNATLVPNANITFGGGTGASRNVVITPVAGESGTATITISVSDGTLNASTNFVLTVNAANTAPTITAIGPQSTNENTPTGPIAFTIGDAETQPSGLTLSGTSSNATLVPNANITFGGGTGASRNVVITPVAGESGTATITIAVSDGTLNASTNFVLTVNAANTAPTITAIGPQSTNENTPTGPIAFTIGDAETQPSGLTLSGTSSNATLVPNANITFGGGTGASRNVVITPATGESGTATITVTVSDGALTASTNFVLTVNANTAPTITAIGPQSTNENTPTPPITFTIGDAETQPSGLTLAGTSSNATLVPNANITFGGGTGASRNVVITPVAGESGTATITIAVSDGTLNASTNFVLTVNAANTAPTITAIGPQSTNENTPTPPITFTIGDAETQPSGLTLAGTSSNATLVPNANITFGGGTGASRNVVITPATGESGTATITVTVSDGALTASTNFVLTVNANTAPTITAIGPQSTNENTPTPPITFTIGDAETQPSGLTLAGTSSNATLVPNANITFGGGTGASRNVVITPVAGETGTATITIAVSDGTLNASTNFVLTVNAANTAPTITAIGPQSTNENTPTPPITFTIGDAETQPSGLTLSGTSSNATLVPNANITFGGGTGANRNVVITPVAGESGTATITVTVGDGALTASTNFVLTVNANTAPTITAIGPQSTNENTPTGPIAFTIGDAETQPSGLTLAGTSSNATLVPNANITFGGGTGADRNVVITPVAGESGTATITIAVSDGTLNASTNFVLTVNAANTAPTITAIGPQSTNENTPTPPITFTIGDAETQPSGLTLAGTSSNATLVPNANITFGGGTGASRNVVITPVAGESGTATITISVSDGTLNASTNFVLTVNAANTAPTITAIGPQSTNENTPTSPIVFTIVDAETQPSGLTLSGSSSNTTLVPNANIIFAGGNGSNRTVVLNPAPGESGTATITVTVSDGTLSASISFVLTVNANTAPTITAIGPQTTNENIPTPDITFTIGDAETQDTGLTLSGTSSNTILVPNANITFGGGNGANRTVVLTPSFGQFGTTTITVTVSDGVLDTSVTFELTVNAVNDTPTISAIGPQSTLENTATASIAFTIGDPETSPDELTLLGTSSNTTLVDDAGFFFDGSGANRSVIITPLPGESGTTTTTLTVSDGVLYASTNFVLTVFPDAPPTITAIGPQVTDQGTPTSPIAFTIGDAESLPGDLMVSGTSSNTTLVPNANIVFSGNAADRMLVITPAPGLSGTTTITITVDDGSESVSISFELAVNAVNNPPTITAIGAQSTNENTPTSPISFTIGDPETPPGTLTLSGTSSNTTLVPDANITFGGSGADRTVVLTPALGESGTTTITITVSDGDLTTDINFVLTVNANTPPTITAIGPQSTNANTPTGAIAFTIGDAETAVGALTLSATSSNAALVPVASIVFGGSGASRNVVLTPAPGLSGTTTITITVSDGDLTTDINFVLTVNANTSPTITAIGPQSTNENTPTGAIAFTIGDAETAVGALTLSATSSNAALVPDANIALGGSGANRTVVLTPAPGQSGTTTITITVSDGNLTTSITFVLTVNPNTPPTITAIGPQSTNEDTPTGAIAFTIGDAETAISALTLSATSSNAALVPDANIALGGSGAARNVVLTPAPGQSGTTTITITVSDGTLTAFINFVLTVNAVNSPPTITAIPAQTTQESTATPAIPFTIGDAETATSALTLAGASSNVALVPVANIVFGGSNEARNVTVTPVPGLSGTATITVTVSDGTGNTPTNFTLTVTAVNDAPTITAITDQTTLEDTPTSAIGFSIGDAESLPADLTLAATSSNATVVPDANIVFSGTGANRTVVITPAGNQSGTSTITVTVSDGTATASINFVLTVNANNDPPTITNINDQTTPENTPTGAIAFTIADVDNPVAALTVTGTSSNAALIPDANIVFGGSGANGTVTLTPLSGASGTATITITVSDGTATGSTTFQLNVNNVNDPPTISMIGDQTTPENTPTGAIPFTVGDAETPAGTLTLTASSSNTALVPIANITFGGSGAARTVTINPGASQSGSATITITVSDGTSSTSTAFNLIITPVNDAPTVTPIANQTTAESTPTGAIPFNIGDAETPAANLIVTGTSSVATLVPNGNIEFGGSGSDRTVTLTPAAGENGSTVITINVGDGTVVTSITFTLTVSAVNDAPTITAITDQTTTEDVATPALPFTVGDGETPATSLTVTASSSNKTLVPDANVVVFGSDISRTVTVTPAANQTGTTTITLTVSDGVQTTSISFQVTVTGANDPPTIASINDQTTPESTATPVINFKVNDSDNPPGSLTVTGTSSNLALVPVANISVAGSGEDRTVTITPASGVSGTATITLTVSDGVATASTSFQLTVTSVNDAPTVTAIPAQTTNEDVPTGSISFAVDDAETPAGTLVVTSSSSNKVLVPDANIIITGSGSATRIVRVTPASNQNGSTTIALTVSDGTLTTQTTFNVTVTPVDDPPTIIAQKALTIPEDTPITLKIEDFTISDPDAINGTYGLIIFPGVNYTAAGNVVTPKLDFDGELSVKVRATEGKLVSPDFPAKITVTDVNIPPVITSQRQNPIIIIVNTSQPLYAGDFNIFDPDSKPEDYTLVVSEGTNYTVSGPNLNVITPTANYQGPLQVVVRASDGKALSEPFTPTIDVRPPSADPLITGQRPLIINEDVTLTLQYEDLLVTDADDSDYPVGFTMTILPGDNYSVSDRQITPTLNYNGFIDVGVMVNDGGRNSNTFVLSIYIIPVNDAPEITVIESGPIFYEPGTGPVSITDEFECIDGDSKFLQLAEIRLVDSSYSPSNDELIFEDTDSIRGVYDAARGVLSLLGNASPAGYITAIRSIQYNYRLTLDNSGNQTPISSEPKEVHINLSDGQLASDTARRSIELRTSVELSIPNTFTPNGDSENNTWAVQPVTNSTQFDDTIVRVYNKRGLLVYESVGLEKEKAWDGTFNGELLPVDTYYYTIDLKLPFIKKTYKGAVMILR